MSDPDQSHSGAASRAAAELTVLFQRAAEGDAAASGQILPLVYEQLRQIAAARMSGERRDHTLQATALVHEAYARLLGPGEVAWVNRKQFFFAAAEAMRRILIEHARGRARLKRGGPGLKRRDINFSAVADLAREDRSDEVIALDDALRRLEEERPRVAQVVHLRFYGGLSVEETAEALGVSARTVNLDWTFARAWLFKQLAEGEEADG